MHRVAALLSLSFAVAACDGETLGVDEAFAIEQAQIERARASFEVIRRLAVLHDLDPVRAHAVLLDHTRDDRLLVRASAVLALVQRHASDEAAHEAARVFTLDPTMPLPEREQVLITTSGRGLPWHAEAVALLMRQARENSWTPRHDWH